MESGDRCLVWANRDSGLESDAANPYKGSGMHQKNRPVADIPKQSPIQVFTGHNVT